MLSRQLPVPFSVFPSTYRSDASKTDIKVDERVDLSNTQRPGREDRYYSERRDPRSSSTKYEIDIEEERRHRRPKDTRIEIEETRFAEPHSRHIDAHIDINRRSRDIDLDIAETQYRSRTTPLQVDITKGWEDKSTYPRDYSKETKTTTFETDRKHSVDMGYYDEDGHYHSFRHGLHKAADRVLHPIHGGRTEREEIVIEREPRRTEVRETIRHVDAGRRGGVPNTITIPSHHIRIGDLLILQGRPCQVIRITTSQHTGQHRYLGVDLFTKELHEESSFVSNPSPSVVVQNMLGPVFKQYRVLDVRGDGRVVAMTETGDVKQGLDVLDQDGLGRRIEDAFAHGRGSVRVLVISDEGRELAVDYKIVHGSRL